MKAGNRLEEHSAPDPITLSVREGHIRCTVESETVEVGPETVLTCDARACHAGEAISDAVCLVSVATGE
jgi:quercetin dioxygenase-like cupin family protein